MGKIRAATEEQRHQIDYALTLLKQARALLRRGGVSSRCLERLQATIASAEGAGRHVRRRVLRASKGPEV
jgi:hypothetical protein